MKLLDSGGAPPYEPDIEIMEFLENQLSVVVRIAPWFLLFAVIIGFVLYLRKRGIL